MSPCWVPPSVTPLAVVRTQTPAAPRRVSPDPVALDQHRLAPHGGRDTRRAGHDLRKVPSVPGRRGPPHSPPHQLDVPIHRGQWVSHVVRRGVEEGVDSASAALSWASARSRSVAGATRQGQSTSPRRRGDAGNPRSPAAHRPGHEVMELPVVLPVAAPPRLPGLAVDRTCLLVKRCVTLYPWSAPPATVASPGGKSTSPR